MSQPALFRFLPRLATSTPWVRLAETTPVGQLSVAGRRWGHDRRFVKREDRTAPLYGVNKVRNLEFILGAAIARKASRVLARVGAVGRVRASEISLVDSPLDDGYGIPLGRAEELMASFEADEGIRLDTTYTSKVVSKRADLLTSGELKGKNVLYRHTFSPAAMRWGEAAFKKAMSRPTSSPSSSPVRWSGALGQT